MAETTVEKLDVNEDAGKAALEQIDANIERAKTLATEGNTEALDALFEENEALISALSGKGSIKAKKEKRDAWTTAVDEGTAAKAEVKKVTEGKVMGPAWDKIEGVPELVNAAAEKLSEGVRLHLKGSQVAKDVAAVVFEAWLKVENSAGAPDILGDMAESKNISKAVLSVAGGGFEDNWDNKEALRKLMRSVQDYRSDVRAEWLRSLDGDTEEAAARRELMAKVLEGKPEDEKASEWVANVYGTSTIGQAEKKRLDYQEKKRAAELTAGGSGAGEGTGDGEGDAGDDKQEPADETNPDEYLRKTVDRLLKDISKAKPETVEKASAETKEAQRKRLEKALEALRAMIAATL
ncbi:hypothetical protein [Streptomyces sp. NRRL S-31]|uniref:hypothetical protein n=1 Tax=Streptomyces sp. NRRL S-31 TaxID=1463898 RepID=UPI00131E6674|nr:hypothetical protein [Streptomyces sp. NRRL S-31]